jgi:hypothetical protein
LEIRLLASRELQLHRLLFVRCAVVRGLCRRKDRRDVASWSQDDKRE